jgi:hypothetical protein
VIDTIVNVVRALDGDGHCAARHQALSHQQTAWRHRPDLAAIFALTERGPTACG